jgi:hypothetical protein
MMLIQNAAQLKAAHPKEWPSFFSGAGVLTTFKAADTGDRAGQYSIRINEQWRICFEWPQDATGPSNVEIVDYH